LSNIASSFSLPWRERVRVRGIASGFTLTSVLSRQGRGKNKLDDAVRRCYS